MIRSNAASFLVRPRAMMAALSLITFATACSTKESATADSTGSPSSTAATSDASAGASKGKIHLEVTGGDNAGTYDVEMKDTGCSYGLAGEHAWGNQYSIDTTDPKQFSSLQLVVPNTKAAASGTSTFQMTVQFGPLFGSGGHSYDVNTRPESSNKGGSGTVTVQDQGKTGKVTFDAKTKDGVGLKGTIDCQDVVRNG
ncbi:MAG TPA: hypothetical protein VF034_02730 [Gemmatimonadaceae bacterium]